MKCLAVNTATTILSVALVDGDRVLHFHETPETRNQGNILFSHIQSALDTNGLTFKDLGLLAVATGPGSFTGIRIGLAALRGIAMAADLPITGVSSFDLFAVEGTAANLVAVESFREELYFRLTAGGTVMTANETPDDFAKRLQSLPMPLVISGDAAEKVAPLLPGATLHPHPIPDARTLARIALARGADKDMPLPFYLREADVSRPKEKSD